MISRYRWTAKMSGIYDYLLALADENGVIRVTHAEIAQALDCSVHSVHHPLSCLVESGVIARDDAHAGRRGCTYRIVAGA